MIDARTLDEIATHQPDFEPGSCRDQFTLRVALDGSYGETHLLDCTEGLVLATRGSLLEEFSLHAIRGARQEHQELDTWLVLELGASSHRLPLMYVERAPLALFLEGCGFSADEPSPSASASTQSDSTPEPGDARDGAITQELEALAGPRRSEEAMEHWGPVHTAHLIEDGRRLISAAADRVAVCWNVRDQSVSWELQKVTWFRLAPDQKTMALRQGDALVLGSLDPDVEPYQLTRELDTIAAIEFSTDGTYLAAADRLGDVLVWDVERREEVFFLDRDRSVPHSVLTWFPDEPRLLLANEEGSFELWDVRDDSLVHVLPGEEGVPTVATTSPEGSYVATADDAGDISLWSPDRRFQLFSWTLQGAHATSLAFQSEAEHLIAGLSSGELVFFAVESAEETLRVPAHDGPVRCLSLTPDGQRLISGGHDGALQLWSLDGLLSS